jgi:hypothetical protein
MHYFNRLGKFFWNPKGMIDVSNDEGLIVLSMHDSDTLMRKI